MLLCCVESTSTQVISDPDVESSSAAGSPVKTVDKGQKMKVPSTLLLSRSATEFELQCETDTGYEKPSKRVRRPGKAVTVSSATDLMSGGSLVAASSLNSAGDEVDVTGSSSVLDTSGAAGTTACTDHVSSQRKHRVNYRSKVSDVCV